MNLILKMTLDMIFLGDVYEYLIGQFAANAGKKVGNFTLHMR